MVCRLLFNSQGKGPYRHVFYESPRTTASVQNLYCFTEKKTAFCYIYVNYPFKSHTSTTTGAVLTSRHTSTQAFIITTVFLHPHNRKEHLMHMYEIKTQGCIPFKAQHLCFLHSVRASVQWSSAALCRHLHQMTKQTTNDLWRWVVFEWQHQDE